MNTIETILFFTVLVVGIVLLRLAHFHGVKQKLFYENEATERLDDDVKDIKNDLVNYKCYSHIKWLGMKYPWGKSNFKQMRKEIIQNCSKYTGGHGVIYNSSSYSLCIIKEQKIIYYVIGEDSFDFSEISQTHG